MIVKICSKHFYTVSKYMIGVDYYVSLDIDFSINARIMYM